MGWTEHLKQRGYSIDEGMRAKIGEWWAWYTATHEWYSSTETHEGRTYRVERISIKPARMVCQEWASLLMNERTLISTDDERVNDYLEAIAPRFVLTSQGLVERGFALGTAAWVNRLSGVQVNAETGAVVPSPKARIITQRLDARHIIPISFEDDVCTECGFISKVSVGGRVLDQLQLHLLQEDGYVIETLFFDAQGSQVEVEGRASIFRTGSATPQFALIRPGLENTHSDFSAFGQSVFDDAIGAVKLVDESIDTLHNDMYLGQKMLFLDESMLETRADGSVIIPRERDQQLFRKTEGMPGEGAIDEYNPDLRVDDTTKALDTALQALGMRCGFGSEYFSLDGASGLKTATEVVAEHSDLFRNVRKHENVLGPAIATIIAGHLELARTVKGEALPEEYGEIRVSFDDSVIEDTEAQRARDLREVASGLMQPYEFRMKWYGEDEATAKRMTDGLGLPGEE